MYNNVLKDMIEASKIAREIILNIYRQDFKIKIKSDDSPVTQADLQADEAIRKYLHEKYPEFGFLTEETNDDFKRLDKEYIFIVDPLDGTADFVDKNGEFTTNIALCHNHEIVAGVVSIPVQNLIYFASKDHGAFKLSLEDNVPQKIHVNDKDEDLTCLTSRFHVNENELALIKKHANVIRSVKTVGSSIKACWIAEGKAEITYRLSSGTKEWDTAAFDIIVREAGGVVLKPTFERMTYNRKEVKNIGGYVVANKKENVLL